MAETPSAPVPESLPDDLLRARDRAESLLPWAATGALGDADRAWLEAWLSSTEADHPALVAPLRSELAWLERTARDVQRNVALPDPEQGLDMLLGRIADDRAAAKPAARPDEPAAGPWQRLRAWVDGHGQALAWGCAALVLVQAGSLALLERGSSELDPLDGGTGVVDKKGTVLLKVAFKAQATEGDIRRVLRSAKAQIVDGPTALGLYLLRVDAADVEACVALLSSQPQLVESVQRVKPP